ncbi:hypothetical protein A2950_01325 [Candidatus Kaiserbacteria bacterium RIFCSPLOWO2_01_FULL_55_19]|uniref:Uncharacterized protein n=1 Tax=Candidatus Kaiserbacteria bacterium RIFCSPLOWO2_01_FULL_55_19 TaxID=1798516 RepID=A0A1F6ERX1_9BACT|nr:MAG: hypothetical protein A2950_01325 [Candidatus Kaiserbacteria bacterium RIFCSPLOWO2_01_FULL_55_19]
MSATELKAPKGKTRVIGVDLFDHEHYLIKDCDTQNEAFNLADKKNKERTGSMDDVLYVYDDEGRYLHGDEVSGHGVSP